MINASTLSLLLAVIAGAVSSFFSFSHQAQLFNIISLISLGLVIGSPLLNHWRENRSRSAEESANNTSANTYKGLSDTTSLILSVLGSAFLSFDIHTGTLACRYRIWSCHGEFIAEIPDSNAS